MNVCLCSSCCLMNFHTVLHTSTDQLKSSGVLLSLKHKFQGSSNWSVCSETPHKVQSWHYCSVSLCQPPTRETGLVSDMWKKQYITCIIYCHKDLAWKRVWVSFCFCFLPKLQRIWKMCWERDFPSPVAIFNAVGFLLSCLKSDITF